MDNVNWKMVALTLIGLMIVVGLVFGLNYYVKWNYERGEVNGINQTSQIIYAQLVNNAFQCKPIPITYNNVTANLIAIECLQRGNTTR